jgi:3-carboxy-cis,cis-muconate cycloisomerase
VELAEGLIVHPERMLANLELTGGAIVTERPAVVLAPASGKVRAKNLPTAASVEAADTGRTLGEVLSSHPELSAQFAPAQLSDLLNPARYTGTAGTLIDRALRRCQDHGARNDIGGRRSEQG